MLVNKEKRVRSVESRSGDWLDEYPKKKIVCYIMEWGRRDDDLILLLCSVNYIRIGYVTTNSW